MFNHGTKIKKWQFEDKSMNQGYVAWGEYPLCFAAVLNQARVKLFLSYEVVSQYQFHKNKTTLYI